jgi:hypothetical protein
MPPHRSSAARRASGPSILYVGGFGRSGSTLIGRVLGEAENAICVGETCYLITRGLIEDVECGCGRPFSECEFWGEVGESAFGGWSRVDRVEMAAFDTLASQYRTLPRAFGVRGHRAAARAYAEWIDKVLRAVAAVSGAEVIVEISKDPWFAGILENSPGRRLSILHLVRDSRAVAYSWTRKKERPSRADEQLYMPQFKPGHVASRWMLANGSFHWLGREVDDYVRLRYEDFVTRPSEAIRTISEAVPLDCQLAAGTIEECNVQLDRNHIFSANPMRGSSGRIALKLDDEWVSRMTPADCRRVTAMTWPLLELYDYEPALRQGSRGSS